jgi:hypothetical protein
MFEVRMVPSDPHWFLGLEAIELCDRLGIERDSRVSFTKSCHEKLSLDFARRFEGDFRNTRLVIFKYDVSDLTADDVLSRRLLDETEIYIREDISESRLADLIEAYRRRHASAPAGSVSAAEPRFTARVVIEPQSLSGLEAVDLCRRCNLPPRSVIKFRPHMFDVDESFARQFAAQYRHLTSADFHISTHYLVDGDVVVYDDAHLAINPDIPLLRLYLLVKSSFKDKAE